MSVAITTIQNVIGLFPYKLMTAHQWFSDHPTDSNPFFGPAGSFAGGDLPYGMVYELHDIPATLGHDWTESIIFPIPLGHLVNNVALLSGFGSSLPFDDFFLDRPRGILNFHDNVMESISFETQLGVTAKLWGLYVDIPFITPTQMTFTPTSPAPTPNAATVDGTAITGLTGQGSIALDPDTVAVRVDITAALPGKTEEAGDPVTTFDLGWVNWGDGTGFRTRDIIRGTSWQSWANPQDGVHVLGFSLSLGTEATITQLALARGAFI